MKILFLSQLVPYPLDAGPKLRSYYVIRKLAEDHEVTLLAFCRDTDTRASIQHMENICHQVVTVPMRRSKINDIAALTRSLIKFSPFLIERDQSRLMLRTIMDLLQNQHFNYVHADQLWMASYALLAKKELEKRGGSVKVILDQHNAVFQIPERMAGNTRNIALKAVLKRESKLMARYEVGICQQFDHVVWVTKEDLSAVLRKANGTKGKNLLEDKSQIIPICIDPEIYPEPTNMEEAKDILFLGGMHWPPNAEGITWFVENVFPEIREQFPKIKLMAIGKNPPKTIIGLPGVETPGYVEDPEPYWQRARVFIVPLLSGGGMRVKILDAWAHGVPVVSTTIGAEGINYSSNSDILIGDMKEEIVGWMNRLFTDNQLLNRIGRGGYLTVSNDYNWKTQYMKWNILYQKSLPHK